MTTTTDKVARRKLSLLELATDLDNVSKACKLMGYSRQQFYEIRRAENHTRSRTRATRNLMLSRQRRVSGEYRFCTHRGSILLRFIGSSLMLAGGTCRPRPTAMRPYSPDQPLISLHIPKTAGISVRKLLEGWFPGSALQLHYNGGQLPKRHILMPGMCVHGHFNAMRGFGVQQYYPEAPQFIAFFREPFDRFISQWYYLNRLEREGQPTPTPDILPDFETWLHVRGEEQLTGTNSFSFVWHLPAPPGEAPTDALLDEKFVFIGITERLDASVTTLARVLGKPLSRADVLNATPRLAGDQRRYRGTFERYFADECEIYEKACVRNSISLEMYGLRSRVIG